MGKIYFIKRKKRILLPKKF